MDELIRAELDPVWKRVLIRTKMERKNPANWTQEGNALTFHNANWDYLVDVCGSEIAAVEYLESV